MAKNKINVDVIITTYNEAETIAALLTALNQQSLKANQIIIVDNCSTDQTSELISNFANQYPELKIKLIIKKTNRSQGRNLAINQSKSQLLALTDAGCIPHKNWLEKLVNAYQFNQSKLKTDNLVIAGFYQGMAKTNFQTAMIPYALIMPDRLNLQTFLPASRSMLLPKKIWQHLGGFKPQLNFSEDYELAKRIQAKKIKIIVEPKAIVDWLPRKNFSQFFKMIFSFAKGDILAKTYRPKVALIFLRYVLAWWLLFSQPLILSLLFLSYLAWSIHKNYRYAKKSWFYLPILQLSSDLAVMIGTLSGILEITLKRLQISERGLTKMKIVHLAQFYSPHLGGVEQHLQKINQVLSADHQVFVVTRQHQPQLKLQGKINGVKIIRLPVTEEKKSKLKYKLQLWAALWQHKKLLQQADIIQIHDVFFWLIPFLPFLNRKKIYLTFHGYEGNQLPTWKQIFWHKLAAWYCHKNLAIGAFHQTWYKIKPDLINYGAVEKIAKKNLPLSSKTATYKIIFLGRIAEDTGIMIYLKTIKLAKDQQLKISLDVYGDGPLMQQAKNYVHKHQLAVKFFGFVEKAQQKIPHYDAAFASQYLSILESLVSHVPVLAVYQNQLKKDYLEQTPFSQWIKIGQTPDELLQHLLKLRRKNKKLEANLDQAQTWAEQQNWQNLVQQYYKLWQ